MAGSSTSKDDLEGARESNPGVFSTGEHTADHESAPLVATGFGDRCVSCGAPLASDQRYCVECGARRGKTRFPVGGAAPPPEPARSPAPPRAPRRRRVSSSGALVAGIATLLLAMGVGVEIGRLGNNNNTSTQRASSPAVQVVTVGGGGGAAAASTTTTNSTSATSSTRSSGKHAKVVAAPKVTKVVAAKASAAASKVLGAAAPKNPTVTTGQSCSGGAGCQNGHFTGNFFGP